MTQSINLPKGVALFKQSIESCYEHPTALAVRIRQMDQTQRRSVQRASDLALKLLNGTRNTVTDPINQYEASFFEEASALLITEKNQLPVTYDTWQAIKNICNNLFCKRTSSQRVLEGLQRFREASAGSAGTGSLSLQDLIRERITGLETFLGRLKEHEKTQGELFAQLQTSWQRVEGSFSSIEGSDLASFVPFRNALTTFSTALESLVSENADLSKLLQSTKQLRDYLDVTSHEILFSSEGKQSLQKFMTQINQEMSTFMQERERNLGSNKLQERIGALQTADKYFQIYAKVPFLKNQEKNLTRELTEGTQRNEILTKMEPLFRFLELQTKEDASNVTLYLQALERSLNSSLKELKKYAANCGVAHREPAHTFIGWLGKLATRTTECLRTTHYTDAEAGQIRAGVEEVVAAGRRQLEQTTVKLGEIRQSLEGVNQELQSIGQEGDRIKVASPEDTIVFRSTVDPSVAVVQQKKEQLHALARRFETMVTANQSEVWEEFNQLKQAERDGIYGKFYGKLLPGYIDSLSEQDRWRAGEVGFKDTRRLMNHSHRATAIREYARDVR